MPAVVRVGLPGVLAVEDDADDALGVVVADAFDARAEIPCGIAPVPARVLETDQVGELFVAEEELQILPGEPPWAVDLGGRTCRIVEDRCAARRPVQRTLADEFDELGRDRAFGRPHALGGLAETPAVARQRRVDVGGDASASARIAGGRRQAAVVPGLARAGKVEQQGRQRMRLWRA